MPSTKKVLEYDNVNGITLTLKVDKKDDLPHSRRFTITYTKIKPNSSLWPKLSLFLAILFNVLALSYIQINMMAFLIMVIVLSFLVFFWVTHTVQSESVLVIPSVGIQISVKFVCGREDFYIPWASVDDIIINEVIKIGLIMIPAENRVLHYLTVLVKNITNDCESTKLVPLFKYTRPRLRMIETMYAELQTLFTEAHTQSLYNEAGDMG